MFACYLSRARISVSCVCDIRTALLLLLTTNTFVFARVAWLRPAESVGSKPYALWCTCVRVIRVGVRVGWLMQALSKFPKTLFFPRSRTFSTPSSDTKTTYASWKETFTYVFSRNRLFLSHVFVWNTAHAWFSQACACNTSSRSRWMVDASVVYVSEDACFSTVTYFVNTRLRDKNDVCVMKANLYIRFSTEPFVFVTRLCVLYSACVVLSGVCV